MHMNTRPWLEIGPITSEAENRCADTRMVCAPYYSPVPQCRSVSPWCPYHFPTVRDTFTQAGFVLFPAAAKPVSHPICVDLPLALAKPRSTKPIFGPRIPLLPDMRTASFKLLQLLLVYFRLHFKCFNVNSRWPQCWR